MKDIRNADKNTPPFPVIHNIHGEGGDIVSPNQKTDGLRIIDRLSSMKFAIYLLMTVAAAISLGTLIPQQQVPTFYRDNYGNILGFVITVSALDNLYKAWWFYSLIALLGVAITLCAYKRLLRIRSVQGISSLVFHVAIVITLIGAAWSFGAARSATVEIVEGQTVSLERYGLAQGDLTLNDFTIDYYPDYSPRQYTSNVSLSGYKGRDIEEQIYVNMPLRTGNLKIYQSSWGWTMQLREIGPATSPIINLKNYDTYILDESEALAVRAVFIPDYAEDEKGIFSKSPLPKNPRLGLTLLRGDRIVDAAIVAPGQEAALGAYKFDFQNFAYFSGLLIKEDPGVTLVYLGFGLLLMGLVGRYGRLLFEMGGK